MEAQILKDPQTTPTGKVLEEALGEAYSAYNELIKAVTGKNFGLEPNWNYYKDGNAWACKVCFKKKTIFWVTIWEKHFKVAFYFTEKNCSDIAILDIDNSIKVDFKNGKPVGKLLPLVIEIRREEQIKDVLKIIAYKKSLK